MEFKVDVQKAIDEYHIVWLKSYYRFIWWHYIHKMSFEQLMDIRYCEDCKVRVDNTSDISYEICNSTTRWEFCNASHKEC